MTPSPLVTILINNYNYGRFLRDAIESALNQSYGKVEVVVVDDGSTDESRDIISSYGSRIVAVLKENGGQASTLNVGIAASHGEIICLLDADDSFDPGKVERVVPYCQPGSMLYHRLRKDPGGELLPIKIPPANLYEYARRYRFLPYVGSPTSGLIFARDLALRLMPLPTKDVRTCADDFLVRGAALTGKVIALPEVLANYRVHGANAWYSTRGEKPREFMLALEKYLNQKLVEAGKAPFIDFYHSIFALTDVPQCPGALSRLAFSVFLHYPNLTTLKFMLTTLAKAVRLAIMSPASRRSPVPLAKP
jgi:glycosyltransferase involved in cell wall biosynthesis